MYKVNPLLEERESVTFQSVFPLSWALEDGAQTT